MNAQAAGRCVQHARAQRRFDLRRQRLALRIAQVPAERCLEPGQHPGDGNVVVLAGQLAQRQREPVRRGDPGLTHLLPQRIPQQGPQQAVLHLAQVREQMAPAVGVEQEQAIAVVAVVGIRKERRRPSDRRGDRHAPRLAQPHRVNGMRAVLVGEQQLAAQRPQRLRLRDLQTRNPACIVELPVERDAGHAGTRHPRALPIPAGSLRSPPRRLPAGRPSRRQP